MTTANATYNHETFFADVLTRLGLAATPWRMRFFDEWQRFEGTGAGYNPLATTQSGGEDISDPWWNTFVTDEGSVLHVRNYFSLGAGTAATYITLMNGYYPAILTALIDQTITDRTAVTNQLRTWGTTGFAAEIESGWSPAAGAPPPPAPAPAGEIPQGSSPASGSSGGTPLAGPMLVFTREPVNTFTITGWFGQWYGTGADAYQHRGVDFGCPEGSPVFAPAAGAVVEFTNDGSFGIGVCLDHEHTPWYSLYAHLSRAFVRPGDRVAPGKIIGLSGAPGRVTGPHLHWQVCKSTAFPTDINQSADPLSFMAVKPEEKALAKDDVKAICEEFVSQTFPLYLEAYFDKGFSSRPEPRKFWEEEQAIVGATPDVRQIIRDALQRAAEAI